MWQHPRHPQPSAPGLPLTTARLSGLPSQQRPVATSQGIPYYPPRPRQAAGFALVKPVHHGLPTTGANRVPALPHSLAATVSALQAAHQLQWPPYALWRVACQLALASSRGGMLPAWVVSYQRFIAVARFTPRQLATLAEVKAWCRQGLSTKQVLTLLNATAPGVLIEQH
jgi:hypothetical protein